jgi:hypothetical protein
MRFLFFTLLIVTLFSDCNKKEICPPDESIGSLNLMDESKAFMSYDGISTLVFMDSAYLDTAYLKSERGLNKFQARTFVETFCEEEDTRADYYLSTEHFAVNYFDSDTSRRFRVIADLGIAEDFYNKNSTRNNAIVYDLLKLTVHRTNPSASGGVATTEHIVQDRGFASQFSDSLKIKSSRLLIIDNLSIYDKVYSNVFGVLTTNTQPIDTAFIYDRDLGVLAFKDLRADTLTDIKSARWWRLRERR